ncbi:zinc ribbon domain-containing protein [Treponema pectinovorum]|uniref:zinc ribbon domain-containing protein n=1 Tax=Treponema pectinovorum TaxID=164 RepID=UPI0011C9DFF5|nr:zinc ribbon domain-containing protein [Treponema pectinovorum]
MALKSQKPKFFCENCGEEVPKDAKICKHCGRFFSSVKCPQCGASGNPDKFSNGCPVCGYSAGMSSNTAKQKKSFFKNKRPTRNAKKALLSAIDERYESINGFTQKQYNADESLPWWLYLLIFTVLFVVLILFFRFFYN